MLDDRIFRKTTPFVNRKGATFPVVLNLSKDSLMVRQVHHERDGRLLWKGPVEWAIADDNCGAHPYNADT